MHRECLPQAGRDGWEQSCSFHSTCNKQMLRRWVPTTDPATGDTAHQHELWCPNCLCDPFELYGRALEKARLVHGEHPTAEQLIPFVKAEEFLQMASKN